MDGVFMWRGHNYLEHARLIRSRDGTCTADSISRSIEQTSEGRRRSHTHTHAPSTHPNTHNNTKHQGTLNLAKKHYVVSSLWIAGLILLAFFQGAVVPQDRLNAYDRVMRGIDHKQ